MTARKPKSNTAVVASSAELAPVELDPPSPAVTRWIELTEKDVVVDHGGDASKVIPMPRPAWSEPYRDVIGRSWATSYYCSEFANIAIRQGTFGENDGESLNPAKIQVRAKLCGDSSKWVGLTLRAMNDDEWHTAGLGIRPQEAVELANALLAAVAILDGEQ
ncbi:hypothetical protein [Mycolicibacterium sp. 050158]|uniref:hypothetical protein n=1 Tax=Mycolicibacterium sp. 050158 TaxID=3090602 RepID=UPI00299DB427|nr:hypothetical protein [Mycolicibacterium sp. 050158]MDX1890125.1 hypothetical protein [Mycolicibacterium sp. 050158]